MNILCHVNWRVGRGVHTSPVSGSSVLSRGEGSGDPTGLPTHEAVEAFKTPHMPKCIFDASFQWQKYCANLVYPRSAKLAF